MNDQEFEALLRRAEEERDRTVSAAERKYQQDVGAIHRVRELAKDLRPASSNKQPISSLGGEPRATSEATPTPFGHLRPLGSPIRHYRAMTTTTTIRRPNTLKGALIAAGFPGETITAQDLFERLPPSIAVGTNIASVSATVGKLASDGEVFELVAKGTGGKPSLYRVLPRQTESGGNVEKASETVDLTLPD